MDIATERRLLQACIALAGCVPVFAGLAGVLGAGAAFGLSGEPAGDGHVRYLSGLLLGIGLAFWAAIPQIEAHTTRVRLLAAIVVGGGIARLAGAIAGEGGAEAAVLLPLVMELGVTPALALWQRRIASRPWGFAAFRTPFASP